METGPVTPIGRAALAGLALAALAGCNPWASASVGERQFHESCAGCHGAGGRGGPVGPDLTGIARREGGFPRVAVLARLDGYGRGLGHGDAAMPDLSHLLVGRMIPVEPGDGTRRMVPEVIVALSAYLERIQR
jgi:mono/diheme cytochrome c family protein